jgi:biotin--protein ligase
LTSHLLQTIYIYAGSGVSLVALNHTVYTLKKLVGSRYELQAIGPGAIKRHAWTKNAALLVMPGGADLPYGKHLNGQGNKQIDDYIRQGGAYLGFCAGAYYGSKQVEFALKTPMEVVGERELAFFPGLCKGPALAPWDDQSNAGARAALLQWEAPQGPFAANHPFLTYYNGGGYFVKVNRYPHVTVLATYRATKPPKAAIVEIDQGLGRVVLSGVHCEFAPELFDGSDPFLLPIQKKLIPRDGDRLALMAHLLKRLSIETKAP